MITTIAGHFGIVCAKINIHLKGPFVRQLLYLLNITKRKVIWGFVCLLKFLNKILLLALFKLSHRCLLRYNFFLLSTNC